MSDAETCGGCSEFLNVKGQTENGFCGLHKRLVARSGAICEDFDGRARTVSMNEFGSSIKLEVDRGEKNR